MVRNPNFNVFKAKQLQDSLVLNTNASSESKDYMQKHIILKYEEVNINHNHNVAYWFESSITGNTTCVLVDNIQVLNGHYRDLKLIWIKY